jgi:hypothetical protein
MQPTPEQIARHTVDQNGGEYTTDVPDLLALFGRQQLTDVARQEVREALDSVGVGTDPDLWVANRTDAIRLFVAEREWVPTTSSGPSSGGVRALQQRPRPRSWKAWVAVAVVALVVLSLVTQDSNNPKPATPASETIEQSDGEAKSADAAAARRARQEARRERARLRKARVARRRAEAAARRERARVRRARAAARRERERQRQLAAEAAAAEAQAEADAQAAEPSCHPSYDPCLDPNASDYDCAGGSGDGPEYTGFVTVTGPDDYGLDSDGDGTGCES